MKEYIKNSSKLYYKAFKSEEKADIELAIKESISEAKLAMFVFSYLGIKHPDIVENYCKGITEIPAVYSSDNSRNKMFESLARDLGLGENANFNYTGDRHKGINSKLAVERLIEIIEELRTEIMRNSYDKLNSFGVTKNFLLKVKGLPDLETETANEWKSIMTEYAMLWFQADDEEKASNLIMAFPTIDLVQESQSYAESRLEARRAEKKKALDERYPNCERLNLLWQQGERKDTIDHCMELSNYQSELAKIESMDFDSDCWKYAIGRIIGEKLKRLLRSKVN